MLPALPSEAAPHDVDLLLGFNSYEYPPASMSAKFLVAWGYPANLSSTGSSAVPNACFFCPVTEAPGAQRRVLEFCYCVGR